MARIKPVCQYSWYSVDIHTRNLANETVEYFCCDSLHFINKSFQTLLGDTPSLLLAEKAVKRNVFVGLGLISGGKLLISHCGSLGSVQVRSCGIYAAQIILGGFFFFSPGTSVSSCQLYCTPETYLSLIIIVMRLAHLVHSTKDLSALLSLVPVA